MRKEETKRFIGPSHEGQSAVVGGACRIASAAVVTHWVAKRLGRCRHLCSKPDQIKKGNKAKTAASDQVRHSMDGDGKEIYYEKNAFARAPVDTKENLSWRPESSE